MKMLTASCGEKMKIRKATKKDLKEVAKIFREETSKKPYSTKWTEQSSYKAICELFKKAEINLAVIDDKIVGFIISRITPEKKYAYIEELWLKSKYQGKGTGKFLMKFVEDKYKKKGVKNIGITANQKAKALYFYKKLGYKKEHSFFHMNKKLK
ncbi:GNAT family N-acetyltransferase [Candidatus Pacearchaeota archaeon]|nr:GNAT family N-acetyltransferase [Candidatus Pacearchaeota archaeon]